LFYKVKPQQEEHEQQQDE